MGTSSGAGANPRDLMRSDSMLVPSIFPRRWMMPRMFGMMGDSGALDSMPAFGEDFFSDKLSKMNLFQDKGDDQIIRVKDGDNKFVLRQFSRKYTLPEGCEAARVNSNLSSDGVLVISAPKRQAIKAAAGATNTPIPVTHKTTVA